MTDELLRVEYADQVGVWTLNRPEAMNALNRGLLDALAAEVEAVRWRRDVRVVIITGAGPKAFSAGADLKERATLTPDEVARFIATIRDLFTALETLNKPVIAAINGVALGGGLELALACDIRLAADSASMGLVETRLAIIPGAGGTQRLPRLVGSGVAKEMIFTAKRVDAAEAQRIGLVNAVHPPVELMAASRAMAAAIRQTGPVAIEQAKRAINEGLNANLRTGLALESTAYGITIPTRDRLEGLAAFREKRAPVYTGE